MAIMLNEPPYRGRTPHNHPPSGSAVRRFLRKPITVATLQATALSMLSNTIAQVIRTYRAGTSPDLVELLRFVTVAILTAPPNYHWQLFIERKFPAYKEAPPVDDAVVEEGIALLEPGSERGEDSSSPESRKLNWVNTAIKLFIDCFTLGALGNTIAFFLLMGLLKGRSAGRIVDAIYTKTIPTILAGYKIWPFAAVISFTLIPVERRIVFLSMIGLLWGIYMSLVGLNL